MQPHYIEFITVGFGIVLLMLEAFTDGNKTRIGLIAAAGLAVITGLLWCTPLQCDIPKWMSGFYEFDATARFFKTIALVSTILVLLMAIDMKKVLSRYTSGDESGSALGEFFCLPVFACAGLMWMASATNLISIFVALELTTITFYVMVAYMRRNVGSLEAGVKYLILGALSTGFLVYGIAWIYGATGTMNLSDIIFKLSITSETLAEIKHLGHNDANDLLGGILGMSVSIPENLDPINPTYLLFGLALLLIALGFKVGAAPMQLWIPDVYQGAPTPITAFLSVASKAAGFAVMATIFLPFIHSDLVGSQITTVFLVMAGATLIYGNLAALKQTNFKRLLAFSSIAHAGFILMGIAAKNETAVYFYLGTYLLMTFAAFFVLALVRQQENSDTIEAFDGLSKRNPILAATLTITMAALAGIPLTAGFWGKFLIFEAAIDAGTSWWLISIAFISVAAGFYYYLKVVKAMYWNAPRNTSPIHVPIITKSVLAVLTAAILFFGIYPQPILNMLQ